MTTPTPQFQSITIPIPAPISIPIPTDSYDHLNCDNATLESIKTLITCFDSTMDSFQDSIGRLNERVDLIHQRTNRIQERYHAIVQSVQDQDDNVNDTKNDDYDDENVNVDGSQSNKNDCKNALKSSNKIAKVIYPALYEHATQIQDIKSTLYRDSYSSAITQAKQRANEAIRIFIQNEYTKVSAASSSSSCDDYADNALSSSSSPSSSRAHAMMENTTLLSSARLADEWLDRASAFEEDTHCNSALQVDTIPPIQIHPYHHTSSIDMKEKRSNTNSTNSSTIGTCSSHDDYNSESIGGNSVKTIGIHATTTTPTTSILGKYNGAKNQNEIVSSKNSNHNIDILKEEIMYYKRGLIDQEETIQEKNHIHYQTQQQQQHHLSSLLLDEYDHHDGNMSVISEHSKTVAGIGGIGTGTGGMTTTGGDDNNTIISNYTITSHATTSASRRRRQRKIMAMAAAASPSTRSKIMKNQNNDSSTSNNKSLSSSSSRQQIKTGSVSYICDILHDTYGLMNHHGHSHGHGHHQQEQPHRQQYDGNYNNYSHGFDYHTFVPSENVNDLLFLHKNGTRQHYDIKNKVAYKHRNQQQSEEQKQEKQEEKSSQKSQRQQHQKDQENYVVSTSIAVIEDGKNNIVVDDNDKESGSGDGNDGGDGKCEDKSNSVGILERNAGLYKVLEDDSSNDFAS